MKQQKTIKWIHTVWVTACAVLFLFPLLWMLSSSLKTGPEVFSLDFRWLPEVFQWENYVRIWTDSKVPFWRLYVNSLVISVVGTLGQLLISSMTGYALAKIDFQGKNAMFMAMMVTMMIPAQATIIPRYMMFYTIGIYDTLWALILPAFFNITSIFLLRQFYMGTGADGRRPDGRGQPPADLGADYDAPDQTRAGDSDGAVLYQLLERVPQRADLPALQQKFHGLPGHPVLDADDRRVQSDDGGGGKRHRTDHRPVHLYPEVFCGEHRNHRCERMK